MKDKQANAVVHVAKNWAKYRFDYHTRGGDKLLAKLRAAEGKLYAAVRELEMSVASNGGRP